MVSSLFSVGAGRIHCAFTVMHTGMHGLLDKAILCHIFNDTQLVAHRVLLISGLLPKQLQKVTEQQKICCQIKPIILSLTVTAKDVHARYSSSPPTYTTSTLRNFSPLRKKTTNEHQSHPQHLTDLTNVIYRIIIAPNTAYTASDTDTY